MHDILILCSLIFISSFANSTNFYSFSPNTGGSLELVGSLITFFEKLHIYMHICIFTHRSVYMDIC